MILKLIGGSMIIGASSMIGFAASNKYSQRPKDIRRLRASVQMLETEIIYGCTPLPLALSNVSEKLEGALKVFFARTADELLAGQSYNLEAAWDSSLNRLIKESSLNREDKELLISFGRVLGGSDREDQRKHFELFYIQLKQLEEAAEEARQKNEKMFKSLGILSGLVIFIILV